MQAWDQVKVKTGDHAGQAGVIRKVEGDHATVKLDLVEEEVTIPVEDLELL